MEDYSPEAAKFRAKVKTFLSGNLPTDWNGMGNFTKEQRATFVQDWRKILADNQLLAVAWAPAYGGAGLSQLERTILAEELAAVGVPSGSDNDPFSIGMIGHTIIEWGTEEQKQHYLPRILDGTDVWCQGYSEPNSGSDLASLATRADLDGDEWVINGQKIWTSQGHNANWIFVLCRTDPTAVKHAGISFVLCPIDQPGVEVRPIVNASGHHDFNEVFFSDARTSKENVLGGVHNGWAVANTLLAYERGDDSTTNGIRYGDEWTRFVGAAKQNGKISNPVMRQRFAAAYTTTQIMRFMGLQTVARSLQGYSQGPESSLNKLLWSEHHQRFTELAMDVVGMDATAPSGRDSATGVGVDDIGSPYSSQAWVTNFIGARPGSIYSGSNEIQRNIVGERVLGLPKEPRADIGPWNETKRS